MHCTHHFIVVQVDDYGQRKGQLLHIANHMLELLHVDVESIPAVRKQLDVAVATTSLTTLIK